MGSVRRNLIAGARPEELECIRILREAGLAVEHWLPVGGVFAAVAVPDLGLVIEIVGDGRRQAKARARDAERTAEMARLGMTRVPVKRGSATDPLALASIIRRHVGMGKRPTADLKR